MENKWIVIFSIIVIIMPAMNSSAGVSAQNKPKQITDRLFQFIDIRGGNAVFLVTGKDVIVVDAGAYPTDGAKMMEQIKSVTDKPVRYVILTHYHMDHTGGLVNLPSSAAVIGHRNIMDHLKRNELRIKNTLEKDLPAQIDELKKNIETYKKNKDTNLAQAQEKLRGLENYLGEMKGARVVYPSLTFEREMTLYSGYDTIRLIYPGPAHARCNILVHFVNQKTLHTGDMLFQGRFPYIMWTDGPNTENWVKQLEQTLLWDIDIVIPGHGDRTHKAGIRMKIDYLKALRSAVAEAIGKGRTMEQMQREITLSDFGQLEWPHLIRQNVESVFKEMTEK